MSEIGKNCWIIMFLVLVSQLSDSTYSTLFLRISFSYSLEIFIQILRNILISFDNISFFLLPTSSLLRIIAFILSAAIPFETLFIDVNSSLLNVSMLESIFNNCKITLPLYSLFIFSLTLWSKLCAKLVTETKCWKTNDIFRTEKFGTRM